MPQRNLSLANRLIAGLPSADRAVLLQHCELVELALHERLVQAGDNCAHAWFPVEGWVAQQLPVPGTGRSSAPGAGHMGVALVGGEGMFNTSLLLGVARSALHCQVLAAGLAFRIDGESLRRLLEAPTALRERLHRYVHSCQQQLAQQALCMNYHTVEQRLVRCLLMARERTHSSELFLTHDVLAQTLGVRRESVTQAATALQRRGLVSYSRGYLMLLDEPALERLACACFQLDLETYEDSLGPAETPAQEHGPPDTIDPEDRLVHAGCSGADAPSHAVRR